MSGPTFSAISDLYSPTQLRRALREAAQIATELRQQVRHCGWDIGDELALVLARLENAGADAHALDAPPKASNG
jgi:hypothetical protein